MASHTPPHFIGGRLPSSSKSDKFAEGGGHYPILLRLQIWTLPATTYLTAAAATKSSSPILRGVPNPTVLRLQMSSDAPQGGAIVPHNYAFKSQNP